MEYSTVVVVCSREAVTETTSVEVVTFSEGVLVEVTVVDADSSDSVVEYTAPVVDWIGEVVPETSYVIAVDTADVVAGDSMLSVVVYTTPVVDCA